MSLPKQITVNCTKCGKAFTTTVFESVNSNYTKDIAFQIMSGRLFDAECPQCKHISNLDYEFLYHDIQRKAMIWVIHKDSPEYNSKITNVRSTKSPQYKMLRIVEDANALKEKVSCLEQGRDDKVIELCKVFTTVDLLSKQPDFNFQSAFYSIITGTECIHLYDANGEIRYCELSEKIYDFIKELYYNSKYAAQFDGNYAVVDYAWAENILYALLEELEANSSQESNPAQRKESEPMNHPISETVKRCPKCNRKLPADSRFCQYCRTQLNKKVPTRKTSASRVLAWILTGLLAVALCLSLYLLFDLQKENQLLLEQVSELNSTVTSQNSTLIEQKREMAVLEKKAASFDSVRAALHGENIGMASKNFMASQSIIVLTKGRSGDLDLTTNWSGRHEVSVLNSAEDCVFVGALNCFRNKTSSVKFYGKEPGMSVVTFKSSRKNPADNESFQVLVVVTD